MEIYWLAGIAFILGMIGLLAMAAKWYVPGFLLIVVGLIALFVSVPQIWEAEKAAWLAQERQQVEIEQIEAQIGKTQAETRSIDADVVLKMDAHTAFKSLQYGFMFTGLQDFFWPCFLGACGFCVLFGFLLMKARPTG